MARKILRPDPDTLRSEIEAGIPVKELADRYGYRDVSNIYYWMRRYGILTPLEIRRRRRPSERQMQVILGSLFGDGSVMPSDGTGRFSQLKIRHSQTQRDYLIWKMKRLDWLMTMGNPTDVELSSEAYGSGTQAACCSIRHPIFTEMRELFYPDGVKAAPPKAFRQLEPLGLAVWLMDDGSFHRTRRYIHLSTNNFSYEDHELMADLFDECFGVRPYIHSAKGRHKDEWQLAFNRKAADALRPLVKPYFFEPLLYKLGC